MKIFFFSGFFFNFISCSGSHSESGETDELSNSGKIILEDIFQHDTGDKSPYTWPDSIKTGFSNLLDTINIELIEAYVHYLDTAFLVDSNIFKQNDINFDQKIKDLHQILEPDPYLSGIPERVLFLYYNYYQLHALNLLCPTMHYIN